MNSILMKTYYVSIPIILSLLLLLSCGANNGNELQQEIIELNNKIDKLELNMRQEIESNRLERSRLETDISLLKLRWRATEILDNSKALLMPGSSGYSVIETDLGILVVSLNDVKPYANGSQVTLRWGNILNTSINGFRMYIDYGDVDEEGMPNEETMREKEFQSSNRLREGTWNDIEVVLEGVRPENLGFIRLKYFEHIGISLNAN